ncbi:MAG: dTMP kinase [Tissierellia bacterium]|nr:dTMP kinase [Tissierellia bacterium]MDD4780624.1 dTMP kinase [Tissierellia bacterium]
MKGLFIVIEGPDGSGKSTMAKMIGDYFQSKGKEIEFTREPGGTAISEKIREIILDKNNIEMDYKTEALLYAAARAQHVNEKIIPCLKSGKIVISERFVYSSLVYQGIGRKLGINEIKTINDFATSGLQPDLVLFFDINPKKALQRKLGINGGDRLENENISFHNLVYEGYRKIIEYYPNIIIIDASRSIEEIFLDVKNIIENVKF